MPEDHIANLTHSLTGYVNVGLTLYDSNLQKVEMATKILFKLPSTPKTN